MSKGISKDFNFDELDALLSGNEIPISNKSVLENQLVR